MGIQSPAPVVEDFSPASAVFQAPVPVVEYLAPAPTVILSPAPVVEYISPYRLCFKRQRQLRGLLHPRQQTFPLMLELMYVVEAFRALHQDRVQHHLVVMMFLSLLVADA